MNGAACTTSWSAARQFEIRIFGTDGSRRREYVLDSRRHGIQNISDAERQIRETLHQTGVHVITITTQALMDDAPNEELDQTQFELHVLEPEKLASTG